MNIKIKLFKIIRHYLKYRFTGNLGKVVEDDNKITCYVKKNKITKEHHSYTITCRGISKRNIELADIYKINKPICYVIDGFEFKKNKVYIFGYNNCEVLIKNCKFDLDLKMRVDGKCTIDNTNIFPFDILSLDADDLIIKNMEIINPLSIIGKTLKIYIGAKNDLNIINSNIGKDNEKTNISMYATNELNIINSSIVGDQVKLESKQILNDSNSSIIAKEAVDLNTEDFKRINITSPSIVLNGNTIKNDKKLSILEKVDEPLKVKRIQLLDLLKKIKNDCEHSNMKKVDEYKESLTNKPISKILK